MPGTIPIPKPSHRCKACGAELVTQLSRKAWVSVVAGVLLTLATFALYELSASIEWLSPGVRQGIALALLGGAYVFAANRVLRAIEFKLWEKPR